MRPMDMKRRTKSSKLTLLLVVLGLLITGADLISTMRGWEICPFEGCKLALSSSYSSLLGLPLTAWGFGFFLVAFFLWLMPRKWLLFWSALGLGASLYFVYIQKWVLGEMCPMCLVVEFLVFLLFLSSLTRVSFWCVFSLILLAFMGLHSVYTWTHLRQETCLGRDEMNLLQKYYTAGKGSKEAAFFFSLECPACSKILPLVREWALKNGVKVALREVRVHREEGKAFYFLSLLKGGMDPWMALAKVESSSEVPRVELGKREERVVLRLLDFNEKLLESLGIDGVPVLLVMDGDKLEGRKGVNGIRRLLKPTKSSALGLGEGSQGGSLAFPEKGLCTPEGCD